MEFETFAKLLSGGAGVFSVLAILLLLYIVVCEVFFNHGGHTEKVFGKKEFPKSGKHAPIIMPIVTGAVAMVINLIIANWQSGVYITAKGGVMSLMAGNDSLDSVKCTMLCIVSIALFTFGSMIFDKIGGSKFYTLYCLNIAFSLMVLPYTYSLIALLWAVGYWALKKKEYLLLAIVAVLFVAVHFPVDGFHLGEAFMLAYLALIPVMAKLDNAKFKWLTVILSIACGFFTVFSRLIYKFM